MSAAAGAREALVRRLGHSWQREDLLERALTHRSAAHELGQENNERLEFLGDAVLGLVAARWLLERFPGESEGVLARHKSFLVSRRCLHSWAEALGLAAALRLGVGEERSGGRSKPALLADALEAVLGALYLDGGLPSVEDLVKPLLEERLEEQPDLAHQDVKTTLQEWLQGQGEAPPDYELVEAEGPDHAKRYVVACRARGRETIGSGTSKKAAQRRAALEMLRLLQETAESG